MHEMAVTRSMLDLVLEEAARAGARQVTAVNVVLGEMTGVIDRCVETNFVLMSRDTLAEGARLFFRNVPRQARCRKCGRIFRPEGIGWGCPECGAAGLELISGEELFVESIEVE